jgi:hypothetical protein
VVAYVVPTVPGGACSETVILAWEKTDEKTIRSRMKNELRACKRHFELQGWGESCNIFNTPQML